VRAAERTIGIPTVHAKSKIGADGKKSRRPRRTERARRAIAALRAPAAPAGERPSAAATSTGRGGAVAGGTEYARSRTRRPADPGNGRRGAAAGRSGGSDETGTS